MSNSTKPLLAVLSLITLLGAPVPAVRADDHGDARRLRQSGEIVPLKHILRGLKRQHGERILDAELKRRGNRYYYEVEVLNRQGEVWELQFDARNGQFIRREKGH